MHLEMEMSGNDNVRKAVGRLAQAVIEAKGQNYTGQIVVRLNVHKGVVGKVTANAEEVIDPLT